MNMIIIVLGVYYLFDNNAEFGWYIALGLAAISNWIWSASNYSEMVKLGKLLGKLLGKEE